MCRDDHPSCSVLKTISGYLKGITKILRFVRFLTGSLLRKVIYSKEGIITK